MVEVVGGIRLRNILFRKWMDGHLSLADLFRGSFDLICLYRV
jgi:hypothetical protein